MPLQRRRTSAARAIVVMDVILENPDRVSEKTMEFVSHAVEEGRAQHDDES